MERELSLKYKNLLAAVRRYDRVGVACSGGVDSTLLAYACCEALGADRVVVCFADSCLLSGDVRTGISELISRVLPEQVTFLRIPIDNLGDEVFTRNDANRCYVCKKSIYTSILSNLNRLGISTLCDGTNCDDLDEDRPGLRAIEELQILTPLVDAGYTKNDIRKTASDIGLPNAALPSNSCLATRLEPNRSITDQKLREVERHEQFLTERGFSGCRVRPRGDSVILEIQSNDFDGLANPDERNSINSYFQQNGYTTVLIKLSGRSN